jgi:hypothetical protein
MSTGRGPLPNFFVIGAQKCGTTTVHRLLQSHPQAFLCDPKEPDFFSAPRQWARGVDWYASLFAAAGGAVAIGEASTTYSMYPHYGGVVDRLISVVPEPTLIYLTREPLARMRSAYQHALTWGTETRPIGTALREDPRYLLTSCYAMQLDQWLARVPREKILLLSLEELAGAPEVTLGRLLGFLGLDPAWRPPAQPEPENPSAGKRAPRRWWRGVGEVILRYDKTHWVPDWMVRLNEGPSNLTRREIAADELVIPVAVAESLQRALAADQRRLRLIWGESAPDWLLT